MTKLVLLLLTGLSLQASAQNSSSSRESVSGLGSASSPSPTSTENLSTQIEEGKRRFETTFLFEGGAGVADLKENHSKALIESVNEAGLAYKISEKYRAELRHVYTVRLISDREQLKTEVGEKVVIDPQTGRPMKDENGNPLTETQVKYESPYEMMDPTVHLDVSTELAPLGSKPLTFATRYSVPVSELSREAKSQGVIRTQTVFAWDLNPRVLVEYMAQIRLYLHATASANGAAITNPTLGSDSTLRYVTGPTVTYNFNDRFNVYYNPFLDILTTGFQRGDFSHADGRNQMFHDIGLNYVVGPVTINPYWETYASQEQGQTWYQGAGSDSTSSYNLAVTAVF